MTKYAKIAYIAQKGVLPIFSCPRIFFTNMFIIPTFSTTTGFTMAHFEDRKHGKIIESPKGNVVKGQMSAIL